MHTAKLRKVGGSVMVAVPPALLNELDLSAGSMVGVSLEDGRLIVEPRPQRRYSLDELLAEEALAASEEDAAWMTSAPVGRELF